MSHVGDATTEWDRTHMQYNGNIAEQDLEDWCERRLAPFIYPNAFFLGRQVTLPSGGRLDLLFGHVDRGCLHLTVVELKVGKAKMDALVQCLGYVRELRHLPYNNVRVRGLLVAERIDGDVDRIVQEMDCMAATSVAVDLTVRLISPLYDEPSPRGYPARPPDIDSTRASPSTWKREGRGRALRDLLNRLMGETKDSRRHAKPEVRGVALVPARLAPLAVTYPSTNGNGDTP